MTRRKKLYASLLAVTVVLGVTSATGGALCAHCPPACPNLLWCNR
jgi:hypothetical protein